MMSMLSVEIELSDFKCLPRGVEAAQAASVVLERS